MTPSSAPGGASAGAGRPDSVLVSVVSIAVIAGTAVALRALDVPSEVTAPVSTASGALVPMVAIRRGERRKSKLEHVQEMLSGTFARPPVYAVIIAAGLLALTEWATYVVAFVGAAAVSFAGEEAGVLTTEESEVLLGSAGASGAATVLGLLLTMAAAVPIGVYVAHRVRRRDVLVAVAAVGLSQVITFVLLGVLSGFAGFRPWPWVVWVVLVSGAIVLGVARGRSTRSLFLVDRMFRRLREADRRAVLSLIDEQQVAERLA